MKWLSFLRNNYDIVFALGSSMSTSEWTQNDNISKKETRHKLYISGIAHVKPKFPKQCPQRSLTQALKAVMRDGSLMISGLL